MADEVWYATVGINYPGVKGDQRREAGDVCDGLPAKSIPWLRREGAISTTPPGGSVTVTAGAAAAQAEAHASVVGDEPSAEA
jgi:hypothetical protein